MHQTIGETKAKIDSIRKGGERSNGVDSKEVDTKVSWFSKFLNYKKTRKIFQNLKDQKMVASIVGEKGLSAHLTQMDIENIACLVQNELAAIRQIMTQNSSLVAQLKKSSFEKSCDLNEAIIDDHV